MSKDDVVNVQRESSLGSLLMLFCCFASWTNIIELFGHFHEDWPKTVHVHVSISSPVHTFQHQERTLTKSNFRPCTFV